MPKIRTVTGDIQPTDLGITLAHEHVFLDLKCWWFEPEEATLKKMAEEPLKPENFWMLRYRPEISKDNIRLDDEQLAVRELLEFKKNGGDSLVDLTLPGIGRDSEALLRVSRATGLNIIMGTGWYVQRSHPTFVHRCTAAQLAEIMVAELEEGVGQASVKAGVIGEVACSSPLPYHPDERKVLLAAASAQKTTGAPFTIHPAWTDYPNRKIIALGKTYVELLRKKDVNLAKFYLSHADYTCFDLKYLESLLDSGISVSFDTFGCEVHYDNVWPGLRLPTDQERIAAVVQLCREGYDRQIMLAHDMALKMMLKTYGGYGYSHILEHIVPELRRRGVSSKQVRNMLVENPKRVFAF